MTTNYAVATFAKTIALICDSAGIHRKSSSLNGFYITLAFLANTH